MASNPKTTSANRAKRNESSGSRPSSPKAGTSATPQKLRRIVESFSKLSVLVMADLIADEFITGEISRVSREAPVLILKHREQRLIPGGGANAVMNLASLGVTALPVGLIGDDAAGRALLDIL